MKRLLKRLENFIDLRVFRKPDLRIPIDDNLEKIKVAKVIIEWPSNIRKPIVGYTKDVNSKPHWTKFERFLKNNAFEYYEYKYHNSLWLEESSKFDLVIWSPMSGPAELEEMKRKIYILENRLGKKCFPDYETIMLFDDKVMEFYLLNLDNLPVAKTFISHNYSEIYSSINKLNYPLVNKLSYGAGSREVSMVKNEKQARKIVHNSFSLKGRRSNVSYYRQKNYVYLQEFVDGEGLDTRITVIGNMIFGYYRKPKKGDFRASGSGIVIKRDLPIEAIKIALETYYKIGKAMLAVDMVKDKNGQYKIIEISPYIWVITPIQMMVNGIIGGYKLHPDGTLEFVKCSCWPQELALKTFFEQTYLSNPDKWKQQFIKPAIETGNLRKI